MMFTLSDRKEVEGLLSKLTTTVDGLGRSRRDIELFLRTNQHWPADMVMVIRAYGELFNTVLLSADQAEMDVIEVLNATFPLE